MAENEQMENVLDCTIKESNEFDSKEDEANPIQNEKELVEAEDNANGQEIQSKADQSERIEDKVDEKEMTAQE